MNVLGNKYIYCVFDKWKLRYLLLAFTCWVLVSLPQTAKSQDYLDVTNIVNADSFYVPTPDGFTLVVIENDGIISDNDGVIGLTDQAEMDVHGEWHNINSIVLGGFGSHNELWDVGTVTSASAKIGAESGASDNLATVRAYSDFGWDGSWTIKGELIVGDKGSNNTLSVEGGQLKSSSATIGKASSANGNYVSVADYYNTPTGSWDNTGAIIVGDGGSGNILDISSKCFCAGATIGKATNANGNAVFVDAPGIPWVNTGTIIVGDKGSSNILVCGYYGQITSAGGIIGNGSGAHDNYAQVDWGLWSIAGDLSVGVAGTNNTLILSHGGKVNCTNYKQGRSGILKFILWPYANSQLNVTNTARFAGSLQVDASSVTPQLGDSYPIITFGSRDYGSSGSKFKFTNVSGLCLSNGVFLHPEYSSTGLVLKAKSVTRLGQCDGKPNHWGGEHYAKHVSQGSNDSGTICTWGCYLTSLCMALNFEGVTNIPVGGINVINDPGNLNQFMTNHQGNYSPTNSVIPSETVQSINAALGTHLRWNSHLSAGTNTSSPQQLLGALDTGHPVVVGVTSDTHPNGHFPGHFVLVTGITNLNGILDFIIANPAGDGSKNTLSQYNGKFSIRGWIEDPPGDLSSIIISTPANVDLLVTDPLGRSTGYDPVIGQSQREIPDAGYDNDTIIDADTGEFEIGGDHTVQISEALPGAYAITLLGLNSGPYTLTVYSYLPDGTPNPGMFINGLVTQGSTNTVAIAVGTTLNINRQGGNLLRVELATDTGRSFHLEASTDLINWASLGNLTLTNGFAEFMDTNMPNFRSRFYRAVSP